MKKKVGRKQEITDEMIKKALIETSGQPVKASEMLGADYSYIYRRIRQNPELYEIQKAYRSRTFQTVANMSVNALIYGVMQEPETDEDGNIIDGKFKKVKVPMVNRLSLIPTIMQTFKTDDGIKEEVSVQGSIDIAQWLKNNSKSND
nr:MAG TPA: Transcriptional regulator FleQ factor, AAA+, ATPase, c-di-GMP [Caudoviricetes sp.]